ncbi:hypothetical protein [Montanilutibacter psychrotolerans]|uniref:Uncharacterized protein n=1 Tax=Montanilutibacter psychrotolerans TaxID=1327343 RepID=A0A3M8SX77_9GAMM|nr:hypothetical protein [Lysobacter psychrotolerans]RNF85909.1 hypothetical protein EER27_00230 [Lysobacter psychrotolerans]
MTGRPLLVAAAALNAIAALLHIGCIVFGAPWYRFFGAGEGMAQLAEAGSWQPTLITSLIVAVLATWALYALSGAGLVRRLPLRRTVLCLVTAVYLLRGLVVVPMAAFAPASMTPFVLWSSAICVAVGLVHLFGVRGAWSQL